VNKRGSETSANTRARSEIEFVFLISKDMSHPFVVITNECQWEGSAGTLLKKDAFGGQLEIPWPQFVNTLQRHFLIATKQGITNGV